MNGNTIIALAFMVASSAMGQGFIGAEGPTYTVEAEKFRGPDRATGLVIPKGWEEKAEFQQETLRETLPAKFSWMGKLTPIRDQGSCGSCWAFSAQATISDVLALHGKGAVDMSEQWMVSCDAASAGCNGGWFHTAFDLTMRQGDVLENDMPYVGKNLRCPASLPHGYKLASYKSLSAGVASTEAIKSAIYNYGPVAVAVSVTGDFQRYKSGIYNNASGGQVNHAVNLVGWDDTVKPGHWIMRNSWGAAWGENGFMRIAYGVKSIGYAAAYIDIFGPVPQADVKPDPEPTPDPRPECKECSFWGWLARFFAV